MQRKFVFLLAALVLSMLLAGLLMAEPAQAVDVSLPAADLDDDYTITWWTVDGGGGTSQGGVFTVTGTIGQPDAGTIAGGPYVLGSGFWTGEPIYKLFAPAIRR